MWPSIEKGLRLRAPSSDPPRLAVLPFYNLGKFDREYIANEVTEEVRGYLADLEGLRVISRTTATALDRQGTVARVIGPHRRQHGEMPAARLADQADTRRINGEVHRPASGADSAPQ